MLGEPVAGEEMSIDLRDSLGVGLLVGGEGVEAGLADGVFPFGVGAGVDAVGVAAAGQGDVGAFVGRVG